MPRFASPASTPPASRARAALACLPGVVAAAVMAAPAHAARAAPPRPGQAFTLAWGGDVTPGSSFGLPPDHGRTMLAAVAPLLGGADVAAVNLEGTLGLGGRSKCAARRRPNCFAFQAPAANAVALSAAGVDVVNVANNHHFDFGPAGAQLTLHALARAGIHSAGRPGVTTYVDLPLARVAVLGFAAYPWSSPIRDLATVRSLVGRAARHANVVVVLFHGGAEGSTRVHTPDRDEIAFGERRGNPRAFARAAVAAGADLVLGSGPHVLRGLEVIRDRLVAYSLGNLAGFRNFALRGASALSGLLSVRLGPQGTFDGGSFASLRLVAPGLPVADPSRAAARLVTRVSREDFGIRGVVVRPDGSLMRR